MNRRSCSRPGFTLVEVMLTTVLAAVLLLALWSLLSMYSKTFEEGHTRTEQAQLARVLLEQIANDLQNVLVSPHSTTMDSLNSLAPNALAIDPSGAVADGSPVPSNSSAGRLPSQSSPQSSPPSRPSALSRLPAPPAPAGPLRTASALQASSFQASSFQASSFQASGAVAASVPPESSEFAAAFSPAGMSSTADVASSSLRPAGLFGTAAFLQIDVVQPPLLLPRRELDEAVPSDPQIPVGADEIKTVIYAFEEHRDPSNPAAEVGTRLIRREMGWAEAHPARDGQRAGVVAGADFRGESFQGTASDEGAFSNPASGLRATGPGPMSTTPDTIAPLATEDDVATAAMTAIPEVMEFGFRYFDGAIWSEEWDSIARRSLPVAVEVSLRLRSSEELGKPVSQIAVASGVDPQKLEQLKHPLQRMLIPVPFATSSGAGNPALAPGFSGQQNLAGAEPHAGLAP